MQVYVTRMLRFGNTDAHSYIIGVSLDKNQANFTGEVEESWRGGKYEYIVEEFKVNEPVPQEKWDYYVMCKKLKKKI